MRLPPYLSNFLPFLVSKTLTLKPCLFFYAKVQEKLQSSINYSETKCTKHPHSHRHPIMLCYLFVQIYDFRAMSLNPATEAYFAFLDRSWREVAMKSQQLTPKQIQVRSALLITYVSYTMLCRTPFMPNGWRFARAWSIQRARKKVALSKRGRRQGRCRCSPGHRRRISLHT